MALVTGDPGSGKTRLLAEAVSRAGVERRFRVVGYEAERQVPLAAASGLLRALTEVPEHGARLDDLEFAPSAAQPSPLEPVRVFEAAHRALRAPEPRLLVLDDLQWVDDLSLALCEYVIRAAADSDLSLAVLAASRPSVNSSIFAGAVAQALLADRVVLRSLGGLAGRRHDARPREAEPMNEALLALNEEVAGLASDLGLHQAALDRRLLLAITRRMRFGAQSPCSRPPRRRTSSDGSTRQRATSRGRARSALTTRRSRSTSTYSRRACNSGSSSGRPRVAHWRRTCGGGRRL